LKLSAIVGFTFENFKGLQCNFTIDLKDGNMISYILSHSVVLKGDVYNMNFTVGKTKSVSAVVVLCLFSFFENAKGDYEVVDVANSYRQLFSTNYAFRASTVKQKEYPAELGMPSFWFDASDTEGWTIDEVTKEVTKVANKGTSSRYLTASHDEIQVQNYATVNGKYALWYGSLSTIKGPELKESDGTIKGRFLDFGEIGSKKGLWFNPIAASEGATLSNRLTNIGSVIGVYKSYNGGGQLLGGVQWRRYSNSRDQGTNRTDSIIHYGAPPETMYKGSFWHGQQRHAVETSYWPRDWAVLALNPAEAVQFAEGVGCGYCDNVDARTSSGGQAIAELLIFDKVLTDEESAKVVAYLENKWLTPAAGWNGYPPGLPTGNYADRAGRCSPAGLCENWRRTG
jgi:hypothetical protein